MTQQEIEYHLKMLADSVAMLSCMVGIPEYPSLHGEDNVVARKWFKDKLELIFLRCRDIIDHD